VRREQGWPTYGDSVGSSLDGSGRLLTSLAETVGALERDSELARGARRYLPFPKEFQTAARDAEEAINEAIEAVNRARKAISFYKNEMAPKWSPTGSDVR